jgi:hypothetical protein
MCTEQSGAMTVEWFAVVIGRIVDVAALDFHSQSGISAGWAQKCICAGKRLSLLSNIISLHHVEFAIRRICNAEG